MLLDKLSIGVDQDDVVVHHDSRQGDDPGSGHDDRKRLFHNQHADQHAGGGQNHSQQDQRGIIERIKLGQQNDEHQGKRR